MNAKYRKSIKKILGPYKEREIYTTIEVHYTDNTRRSFTWRYLSDKTKQRLLIGGLSKEQVALVAKLVYASGLKSDFE